MTTCRSQSLMKILDNNKQRLTLIDSFIFLFFAIALLVANGKEHVPALPVATQAAIKAYG